MKYHTGLNACIWGQFGQLRVREVCKGGRVQHANVLTASTAHKRNAKENAKESSGNGDGVGRRRKFLWSSKFLGFDGIAAK